MSGDSPDSNDPLRQIASAVASQLESSWNRADAAAFAALFAKDADFVNVRGDYGSGREAIAAAHAQIWATIYAGSTIRYSVSRCRALAPGVLIVHLDAQLHVPAGPLAGDIKAIPSFVLVNSADTWLIAAFHNTQLPPQRSMAP
jgi:uncharacterized protein (TIGR02246 family)